MTDLPRYANLRDGDLMRAKRFTGRLAIVLAAWVVAVMAGVVML